MILRPSFLPFSKLVRGKGVLRSAQARRSENFAWLRAAVHARRARLRLHGSRSLRDRLGVRYWVL